LARELKVKHRDEGLALVRIHSDWIYLLSLDGHIQSQRNPRDISTAWISTDARAVAWAIFRLKENEFPACPDPVIVEMLGSSEKWQLPGNMVNVAAMAVSADGKRVAFDGTYKPKGTGFTASTAKERSRWIKGLQYIDSQTNDMTTILPLSDDEGRVTSINFSPDGDQFIYDYRNTIYLFDTRSRSSRSISEGASPTWSPNGKWIGFRSRNDELMTLDAKTFQRKALVGHRKTRTPVLWSPDSRYVAFAEPLDPGYSSQMVVERIEDQATAVVYRFESDGISNLGFYWITNYSTFLRRVSELPAIKACDGALEPVLFLRRLWQPDRQDRRGNGAIDYHQHPGRSGHESRKTTLKVESLWIARRQE
jgi:Tol biopolymer transport system component